MTIKYAKLTVNKGPMEKIARCVPLYEIPLLRAIHGDTSVQILEEIEREGDAPDAMEEFARFARVYRDHPKAGVPIVEYVYGRPTTGALERAIESSVVKSRRSKTVAESAEAA